MRLTVMSNTHTYTHTLRDVGSTNARRHVSPVLDILVTHIKTRDGRIFFEANGRLVRFVV